MKQEPFFTSDTHWNHGNIIKYQPNRECQDIEEHNEKLVERWNRKVPKSAIVFHLGDFGWYKKQDYDKARALIKSLNGQIFWIKGNHDYGEFMSAVEDLFVKVDKMMDIRIYDEDAPHKTQDIVLCHYPLLVWNKAYYGAWQLHGHCHNNLNEPFLTTRMDVGVDAHPLLEPFSYQEVKAIMKTREYIPIDHHEPEEKKEMDEKYNQ